MTFQDLVGKTITEAKQMKHKTFDDEGFLHLVFSDGTEAFIVAAHDAWSENAINEYPSAIYIYENEVNLIDIE